MQAVQRRLRSRISSSGRGAVFTPKDFLDIGARDAVDQALRRLVHRGFIRRVGRGLYHYPRTNAQLGIDMPPRIDDLAQAIGRQTGSRVTPSGSVAANRLGLSKQVPAKPTYLSDGRSRDVRVGKTTIRLKHASPKRLLPVRPVSAEVFLALDYLGKDGITESVIQSIRKHLTPSQCQQLVRDARYAADWIADAARRIRGNAEGLLNG